jgi:hypothetical protein
LASYGDYGLLEILHEPEAVIGVCSFGNRNQEVEDLAAARRARGIPDDEFVAATMGEEFSLSCPLAALF